MYGCARFQAWNAATWAQDVVDLKARREGTIRYFVQQYQAMLEDNLDAYLANFDNYMRSRKAS